MEQQSGDDGAGRALEAVDQPRDVLEDQQGVQAIDATVSVHVSSVLACHRRYQLNAELKDQHGVDDVHGSIAVGVSEERWLGRRWLRR